MRPLAKALRLPGCAALAMCLLLWKGAPAGTDTASAERDLEHLVETYAKSIDLADTGLADQIWSAAPEVTFIHPQGEERGRAAIEANVYKNLMGATFSERRLTPRSVSVHVYGETAWSEFQWDFAATARKDGSTVHSQGRETQIYRRENGQWRIVHVHYSGQPVRGNGS